MATGQGLSFPRGGCMRMKCLVLRRPRNSGLFGVTILAQITFLLSKILILRLVMTHI